MRDTYKIFDKAGSSWVLDKDRKKLKRLVKDIIRKNSRFVPGEVVGYDNGMSVSASKIVSVKKPGLYEIEFDGLRIVVPETCLFRIDEFDI